MNQRFPVCESKTHGKGDIMGVFTLQIMTHSDGCPFAKLNIWKIFQALILSVTI